MEAEDDDSSSMIYLKKWNGNYFKMNSIGNTSFLIPRIWQINKEHIDVTSSSIKNYMIKIIKWFFLLKDLNEVIATIAEEFKGAIHRERDRERERNLISLSASGFLLNRISSNRTTNTCPGSIRFY